MHALNRHHLIGSTEKAGATVDNAAMGSFFARLEKNVLDRKRWRAREELRIAIITWIKRTYQRRRLQARLGRLTPDRVRDHHESGRPRGLNPADTYSCISPEICVGSEADVSETANFEAGAYQALAGSSRCSSTSSSRSSEWNFAKFDGPRRIKPRAIERAAARTVGLSYSSGIAPSGT